MSESGFFKARGITRSTSTPQERLQQFIDARPTRLRIYDAPYTYIGQWGRPGERATCSIASRLNGLIGLGAISISDAQIVHDRMASGDTFSWSFNDHLGLYVPYANWRTHGESLNRMNLPCRIEYSDMPGAQDLGRKALLHCIVQSAKKDIAIVLSQVDICHDLVAVPAENDTLSVIDSRKPNEPQAKDPEYIVDQLLAHENNYLQLLYDVPTFPTQAAEPIT